MIFDLPDEHLCEDQLCRQKLVKFIQYLEYYYCENIKTIFPDYSIFFPLDVSSPTKNSGVAGVRSEIVSGEGPAIQLAAWRTLVSLRW